MDKKAKFLTFSLDDQLYGAPIEIVREITGMTPITRIPSSSGFLKGVVNLRDKVIPIVDLRAVFTLEEKEFSRETCIIIANIEDLELGFIVDTVQDVHEFAPDSIEKAPEVGEHDPMSERILGLGRVDGTMVILIDFAAVFGKDAHGEIIESTSSAS